MRHISSSLRLGINSSPASRHFSFALPPCTLALAVPRRRATTLYRGISEEEDPLRSTPPGARAATPSTANLGPQYAVKSSAMFADAADSGDGARAAEARRGRSYKDALAAIHAMVSGRAPNRSPENLMITRRLVDRLELQPVLDRLHFVHIAGTKGKGTTAVYTAALLRAYGFKVGLFTSPHLVDVRERTMVDGAVLPEDVYAKHFFDFKARFDALQHSESDLDREITTSRANFFRFMFLFSLYVFAEEQVQIAVLEVGLGGRIDSTNVVAPDVTVVTSLGLDHTAILGDSVEQIAAEKAGILKEGVVCFAAPQRDHPETRAVLESRAREVQAPLVFIDPPVFPIRSWPLLAIGGDAAVENSKLAVMAARKVAGIPPVAPLDETEKRVLRSTTYAGRSQIAPVGSEVFYLDGAHTPESIDAATRWFLQASADYTARADQWRGGAAAQPSRPPPEPRRVLVLYSSRDPRTILKAFMPYVSKFSKVVILPVHNESVAQQRAGPSAADEPAMLDSIAQEEVQHLGERWQDLYREVPCLPCTTPVRTLDALLDLALPSAGPGDDASRQTHIFVTGSFYLIGEMLSLIGARV